MGSQDEDSLATKCFICLFIKGIFDIIPNIIFFCAGLSLVIFTSYAFFHFHSGDINDEYNKTVIKESNIAFGTIIVAENILCVLSILSCAWNQKFDEICGLLKCRIYMVIFFLVLVLEIIGLIFAFLASSHIESTDGGEKKKFDGSNLYILGIVISVIVCIKLFICPIFLALVMTLKCLRNITD